MDVYFVCVENISCLFKLRENMNYYQLSLNILLLYVLIDLLCSFCTSRLLLLSVIFLFYLFPVLIILPSKLIMNSFTQYF